MTATNGLSVGFLDSCRVVAAADECLRKSPYHVLRHVLCVCDEGILFLQGRLSSFYYKQLAQEAVARVEGVKQVVNDIEVACPNIDKPENGSAA
jgi:osmotically-inducible protein OsmY